MTESRSDKDKDLKYKVYLEERKSLIDAKREQTRLFDRAILTLTSGAFALSLLFFREIAPKPESWTVPILAAAWISFCVSLLSTLISFVTSQYACSHQIKVLEAEDSKQEETGTKNIARTCTKILNWVSLIFFVIGVILLTVFGISNLPS